ncbi:MAG TPA: hypothetical protein PKB02_02385 [Anaerohalosphaeraceae bacterium]|nr:hypothetical protein [Anaerohalosphaeraceae bacterium]
MDPRTYEYVKNMLPPDEPIPDSFMQLHEQVRIYADRVQGGQPLGVDVLALMMAQCRNAKVSIPVSAQQADDDSGDDGDPESNGNPVKLKPGDIVQVFFESKLRQGKVIGYGQGPEKGHYRVKLDGDDLKYRTFPPGDVRKVEK